MSLSPEQWGEIGTKTTSILDAQESTTRNLLFLGLETTEYSWPGISEGETAYLRRYQDRVLLLGVRTLREVTTHSLTIRDDESYRELRFNATGMTLGPVFNGIFQQSLKRQAGHAKDRFDHKRWPARPKDYQRLYDEVERGYLYFLTGDSN